MRLKESEIKIIKKNILKYFKDAKIILFGSRVYDHKKGGDIDICIETNEKVSLKKQLKILTDIEIQGIERKIDLLFKSDSIKNQNIFKTINQEGIVL